MATTFNTPGVYIQEIPTLPFSVSPVDTAIPAFIGYTQTALLNGVSVSGVPTRISSLLEFQQIFGGAFPETFAITVADSSPPVVRTITITSAPTTPTFKLYYSMLLYFQNGGGPCYILSIGDYTTSSFSASAFQLGLSTLKNYDEPTLIVFPDAVKVTDAAAYGTVVSTALLVCNTMQDRFTIADVFGDTMASVAAYRNAVGLSNLKYGAAYMPYLNTIYSYGISPASVVTYTHGSYDDSAMIEPSGPLSTYAPGGGGAYPNVYNAIIDKINSSYKVTVPPSGAIAGIYASVDRDRGVWKAPANVSISGVSGPTINITNADQEGLNVDPSGKSINAIRTFAGKGTIVWGARTLAGNDNEWRYVPVRRLFNMVEESTKKASEFVVFESNNANTWQRVKGMIEAFLTNLWRDGALAGATTKDAFFVRVGLGETMSADDILNGRLIVEIGMAAVRPAEFIILKFSHKLQES